MSLTTGLLVLVVEPLRVPEHPRLSWHASPEEGRTPRKSRGAKDHRFPSHVSKIVLSIVKIGPPRQTPYIRTSHRKVRSSVRSGPPGKTRTNHCLVGKQGGRPMASILNAMKYGKSLHSAPLSVAGTPP